MTFVAHRDRVLSCIEKAKAEGAELLCGGSAVSGTTGYFVEPTVFRVDSNALSICQEEVFGPVVTIQVFDDEEEALESPITAVSASSGIAGPKAYRELRFSACDRCRHTLD